MIKAYHKSAHFFDPLLTFIKETEKWHLLVTPLVLLDQLTYDVEMHHLLFRQSAIPVQEQIKYLQPEVICQLLESPSVDLLKKQVQLCTQAAATPVGIDVLRSLKPCRVWMRLCLLLVAKHPDECDLEVRRLLDLQIWASEDKELWDSVRPGLIIYGLKQRKIRDVYKEVIPEDVLLSMRKDSPKFSELFN